MIGCGVCGGTLEIVAASLFGLGGAGLMATYITSSFRRDRHHKVVNVSHEEDKTHIKKDEHRVL